MFSPKEIGIIIATTIVLAFSVTLVKSMDVFLYALISIFIILLANTLAKKISGYSFDADVEVGIWGFKRYGFKPEKKSKKEIPAGLIFPILSKIIFIPFGMFTWMASMVFEVKAKVYRAAKRQGYYAFSSMNESHIAQIAATGIIINLFLALAGYFIGFPLFAKLNIWFAVFNMIPLSNLDGNKIFFGNITLWNVLATITLIAFGYSIFLV